MLNTWKEPCEFMSVSGGAALCRLIYVGANTISILNYGDEVRSSKTHLELPINVMAASR